MWYYRYSSTSNSNNFIVKVVIVDETTNKIGIKKLDKGRKLEKGNTKRKKM